MRSASAIRIPDPCRRRRGAAAEMEQHLRRLHFMWRLSRGSEPGGIAV
jgi:hypothetical protein